MGKRITPVDTTKKVARRPAITPEARENQMIALAVDLAERQLLEGTASSQVITHYGERGVALLSSATPVRSGLTANSWSYEIENSGGSARIVWTNSNIVGEKYNLAVLIQYGHGTGTGGYVTGIDYINPTLRPLFEEMANSIWKELTSV